MSEVYVGDLERKNSGSGCVSLQKKKVVQKDGAE